jgi:UDP-N-acetylmuramoyl-tripeptide--D-alanyl-D-alanine ligase
MNAQERLAHLRVATQAAPVVTCEAGPRVILFLSFSDGRTRARVVTGTGPDADTAWNVATARLPGEADALRWLRADWVNAVDRTDWRELRERLGRTKRNYFRLGVSLDGDLAHAFLETELNANACFYGGRTEPCATLNERNFATYAQRRHGIRAIDFADAVPVWTFSTGGAFIGEDGVLHPLEPTGRDGGRRRVAQLDPEMLAGLIADGSAYLARQVREDGRFDYGWHPCFDRPIAAYNALRHASSTYAMLEAWEVTRDPALLAAIERALDALTGRLIQQVKLPDDTSAAFLVDEGDEIKLGGNAVCILALAKYEELTGSTVYRPLLELLGEGILHMQDADSGRFVHVLNQPALDVKQPFRIIYYDGEAAFALMRLHDLTGDGRWVAAVERAFVYFLAAGHARAHDHWLAYAADALTRQRPDDAWFRFGVDNVRDYLDFVANRITTFPTLLELMTASERLVSRLRANPARHSLLDGLDLPAFYRALHLRAHYLLNGHFWPELAMFFANPARIAGSFFIRHHGFRVRIDDVEHYLSGLIAYRRYLLERPRGHETELPRSATGWTAAGVAGATGGRWVTPPPDGWTASGLCIFAPSFRPGDMVVARSGESVAGLAPPALAALPAAPAALLTSAPEALPQSGVPILEVADTGEAILALGRHARAQYTGKLIGVTGSAGKTTMVAMLAHALAPYGAVAQTRFNANLPHGTAWNLASADWATPHTVLELAIGRMRQNAELARPDVAVFTNILPAHLEYHRDLATIALRKSAVFEGMRPGGIAVLNRDMHEWSAVRDRALAQGLEILSYGHGADAAFRLLHYDATSGEVHAQTPTGETRYRLGARGAHMALNSLAVAATLAALGQEAAPGLETLAQFDSLDGRGAEWPLVVGHRRVTIIDDSYNANPGSMEAALRRLGEAQGRGRVAVLGEMLELGPEAAAYHTALAPLIEACGIRQVHTVGDLYEEFRARIGRHRHGLHVAQAEMLEPGLLAMLQDGDVVLLKGSHGSLIHRIAAQLRQLSRDQASAERIEPPNRPAMTAAIGSQA